MDIYQNIPNKNIFLSFHKNLIKQKKIRLLFCTLAFSIYSFNVTANEDDYYKAIEAEADTIHIDSMNSNKPTAPDNSQTLNWYEKHNITKAQLDQFEALLRSRFPKSFSSYQRLDSDQKAAVNQAYFSNSNSLVAAIQKLYKFQFNK